MNHVSIVSRMKNCSLCGADLRFVEYSMCAENCVLYTKNDGPILAHLYQKTCICGAVYFPGFRCTDMNTYAPSTCEGLVWELRDPSFHKYVVVSRATVFEREYVIL